MSGWSNTASSVLTANTVIVVAGDPNTGVFIYSGTPANGNLIMSMTAAAGTDPYGNDYGSGIVSYPNTGAHSGGVKINAGEIELGQPPNFTNAATLRQSLFFGGDIQLDTGTGDASHLQAANLALTAGTASTGTGTASTPNLALTDDGGSSAVDILLSGSVISTDVLGNPHTWQTPAYNPGWAGDSAVGGVLQSLQYRIDAQNNLVLDGVMHTTSATPSSVAFTLPSGYHPTGKGRRFITMSNTSGLVPVYVTVGTSGDVSVTNNPSASNVDVMFEVSIPLGALS